MPKVQDILMVGYLRHFSLPERILSKNAGTRGAILQQSDGHTRGEIVLATT